MNKNSKYKKKIINKEQNKLTASLSENKIIEENIQKEVKRLSLSLRGSKIKDISNQKDKFNNILYYNENKIYYQLILKECKKFEQETPEAFLFCSNMESFNLP